MSAANRSSSAPVRATALSTIRTTPKWSIASKPEIKMSFQSAPGPGAYNVPSADKFGKFGSPPHFSIAAAGRTDVGKGHQPPGPGAYTPDKGMGRLRGGCIARSGRGADSARSQSPGPGAYNLKNMLSTRNGAIPRSGRGAGDAREHIRLLCQVIIPRRTRFLENGRCQQALHRRVRRL